jgi:glutamate formiminotransferase
VIESIPNISEGRRAAVIADIADAVRRAPGARLLDVTSDPDHHRSVFTLAGSADAVERAILELIARAVAAIDLRTHRGVHPRIGAVDVVPFVPLEGATMAECVVLARRIGEQIAGRFGIPVFLYEAAAANPGRARLEHIRRGGLAALARRMTTSEWAPDFGPAAPHPTAGVTVVGARPPLIAYNINLASTDLAAARAIAAAVRERDGGLPFVKALGLRLEERGAVQVSMNLTDYTRTSIPQVFGAVSAEAARRGLTVLDSEIVGLVPRAAIAGIATRDVGLRTFRDDQVLESRLDASA